jgi:cell division septation protein DedD
MKILTAIIFAGLLASVTPSLAQGSYEDQARSILQLFESGQKDSAYALIEPLKKSARFVPAVLFTRAQMTPDDRALNLYREAIALDPTGPWADSSAYELVRRYVEKGDSTAAYAWADVLKKRYPNSARLASADQLLAGVTKWEMADDEQPEKKPAAKKETGVAATPQKKTKPTAKENAPVSATKTKGTNEPVARKETGTAATPKNMRGYALQVGVFPSQKLADERLAELKKHNLQATALPKMIDGKKQYALVIGPYATKAEADKKKPGVATACDCQAFVVKVE